MKWKVGDPASPSPPGVGFECNACLANVHHHHRGVEDGDGDDDVEEDGEKKNYDDDDDYKDNGDDEDDLPALVAQQCEPIEASPVGHTGRNLPQT